MFLFRKLKGSFKTTDEKQAEKDIDDDDLSFDLSIYRQMANSIESAISGAGTNEEIVESAIKKLRTKSDWLQLYIEFGTRSSWGSSGDLVQWIIEDIDGSDLLPISNHLNSIGVHVF